MNKPLIVFLVGPTAAGKTETAIHLAKKLSAEIISCDSMQIYKGMDIISCLAQPALRKKTKHHLIDFVDPRKDYDVCRWRRRAQQVVRGIIRRKKLALFTGGTGLYMSVFIDGLFADPAKDRKLRLRLEGLAEKKGSVYLHGRLRSVDPEAAARIHPNDARRIIRALEVHQATGKKISELQKNRRGLSAEYRIRIFCLDMDRRSLYRRIDERVERMFEEGLLGEVKKLLKLRLGRTAGFAIGIRELKDYLSGKYDLEAAKELIKRNTRRFAKRQLTWFRKDKRIERVKVAANEAPVHVAGRIFKKLNHLK